MEKRVKRAQWWWSMIGGMVSNVCVTGSIHSVWENSLERVLLGKVQVQKKDADRFLIYVPTSLAGDLIALFHKNLLSPGATLLAETAHQLFYIK